MILSHLNLCRRHIEVHGRPTPAVFRNKPRDNGGSRNTFRLVWTVDSYTTILEYRLLYRQIKPYHPVRTKKAISCMFHGSREGYRSGYAKVGPCFQGLVDIHGILENSSPSPPPSSVFSFDHIPPTPPPDRLPLMIDF